MKKQIQLLERGIHTWSADSVRLILTPSATAKNLYFYTQETGYFKTSYPYFSERQNLDSFLIVYTVSGKGYLEYEGQTYTLTKGQCFYINCQEHHLYRTDKKEDWELLWVHFNGGNALGYYKEYVRNGFHIADCQDDDYIENTIREVLSRHQKKDSTTEPVVSHLIDGLLTKLLVQNSAGSSDDFILPDFIREIAREIDKDFRNQLSLSYFEENYHRSRFHIAKEFKKYMGITVNEYLINARISYAKELLKYTDMPVGEIAFASGMNNVTHFINLFKSREEITPLAYRKAWRG
ncbi:MAG: AraC family ligand binding domain-containing protein [Clostridiales bacterium]|nr:AraC family ligand binding domain-containing protein [Clostridiales bacterium]